MTFIRTSVSGGVGEIVLDRPNALNALDPSMIRDLHEPLLAWREDPAVETVLVTSASERAFCAGGDIKAVRAAVLRRDPQFVHEFFASEYRLNELIGEYPKPYVALIDGAAMGGGLGISVHGSVRVVTERAVLAMPETAIGFFPDVGAGHFLPRLRGAAGMYLGLTGARAGAGDALAFGLATHFVPSERLPELADAIRAGSLTEGLDKFAEAAAEAPLADRQAQIDEVFGSGTPAQMLGRLTGADAWTEQTRAAMLAHSPTSQFVTAELITRGATDSLSGCLERELALTGPVTRAPDFAEGVRAVLVDKDRNPSWSPATLDAVDPDAIAALFG
ncbi:enoyl-CoA hydratase/isomerase family protein [Rhodococcus spelaei]|uniref:3-hydroxyisobutyryl-CoA hydrolase n=1 Tax=Rhodococcus spelaei TaxID=2546320 RepID=A0A541BNT0_9NOCA|nr:enoyl-CoA hydratase/isomerase family protein [Rhodococcus spelaei]TQF73984.1 enoyl-CoA hydratase/isomerase family protein [Rhodococcus spelaei]